MSLESIIRENVVNRLTKQGPGAYRRLAEHMGTSKQNLSMIMNGVRRVRIDHLEQFAAYFQCSAASLLRETAGGKD